MFGKNKGYKMSLSLSLGRGEGGGVIVNMPLRHHLCCFTPPLIFMGFWIQIGLVALLLEVQPRDIVPSLVAIRVCRCAKKQPIVSIFSIDTECRSMTSLATELTWLSYIFARLVFNLFNLQLSYVIILVLVYERESSISCSY